jgi:hypothetical protein
MPRRSRYIDIGALNWVYDQMEDSELSSSAKLLLFALIIYARANDTCFPSRETLCKTTRLASSTVKSALDELNSAGLLEVVVRPRANNRNQSNLYRLRVQGVGPNFGPLVERTQGSESDPRVGPKFGPEVTTELEVKEKETPTPDGVSSLLPGFTPAPAKPAPAPKEDPLITANLREFIGWFKSEYTFVHDGAQYVLLSGDANHIKRLLGIYGLDKLKSMASLMFTIDQYPFNLAHGVRQLSTHCNELERELLARGQGK